MGIEVIAAFTALLIAAGTIFTAIFSARSKTEKTLLEQIEILRGDIKKIEARETDSQKKYNDLYRLYEKEKSRGDRLERQLRELRKGSKSKRKVT